VSQMVMAMVFATDLKLLEVNMRLVMLKSKADARSIGGTKASHIRTPHKSITEATIWSMKLLMYALAAIMYFVHTLSVDLRAQSMDNGAA
jgi:hypothetical protein